AAEDGVHCGAAVIHLHRSGRAVERNRIRKSHGLVRAAGAENQSRTVRHETAAGPSHVSRAAAERDDAVGGVGGKTAASGPLHLRRGRADRAAEVAVAEADDTTADGKVRGAAAAAD